MGYLNTRCPIAVCYVLLILLDFGCVESDDPPVDGTDDGDAGTNVDTDTVLPSATYDGFEELYVLTGNDDPTDVCRVRYELVAVGTPSVSCDQCEWEVELEKRNPSTVLDLDGACANSALGLDDATITAAVGERIAYGYMKEYMGHSNVLMRLNEAQGVWEGVDVANWNPDTGELLYDRRDGYCDYASDADPDTSVQGICGLSGEATVFPL